MQWLKYDVMTWWIHHYRKELLKNNADSIHTLWTQSLHSVSPIHLSRAFGVKTRRKFLACRIELSKLLSNFPASNRSTSMNTENSLSCMWTFNKLKEIKHCYYHRVKFRIQYSSYFIDSNAQSLLRKTNAFTSLTGSHWNVYSWWKHLGSYLGNWHLVVGHSHLK